MPARPRYQTSYLEPPVTRSGLRASVADPAPSPLEVLIASQEPHRAEDEASRELPTHLLPDTERLLVEWWVSGLSQKEIGFFFGVRSQAITKRMKKAIQFMRQSVGVGR